MTVVEKTELKLTFLPTNSQRSQNLLAPEVPNMFSKPQGKIPINVSSLCINRLFPHPSPTSFLFNGHTILQRFSQDMVIYEPPPLQYSTRSFDLIFGKIPLASLEFSLISFCHLSFPLVGQQTLFQQIHLVRIPLTIFNY